MVPGMKTARVDAGCRTQSLSRRHLQMAQMAQTAALGQRTGNGLAQTRSAQHLSNLRSFGIPAALSLSACCEVERAQVAAHKFGENRGTPHAPFLGSGRPAGVPRFARTERSTGLQEGKRFTENGTIVVLSFVTFR